MEPELDPLAAIGPQLVTILRRRVIRNELLAGSRISEAEIARQFNISRQPVREAFIKLAQEGLIEVRPQRGTVVRTIALSEVLDARFVREAVEADIVRIVAASADKATVAILREELRQQQVLARSTPEEFIRADERFHRTLADAAGQRSVWDILQGLKAQMDRVRFLSFELDTCDRLIAQHTEIVDGIAERDSGGAEAALRRHLRAVLEDLPEIMRAHPGVFDTALPEKAAAFNPTERRTR
ncbi:GntR family transcriptional regulator [Tropicimonas sp.]|uniref:GntR family transcriptional regulator n=1 Tax=Tropicimonas sp. TaxID=2067044 RepID=UPI003A8A2AE1